MNKKTWDSINKALGLPKRKYPKKFGEVIELTHAESFSGENNPAYGTKHTDEWKEEHSKRTSGKNNAMYGLKGKDHPAHASHNNYRETPEYKKNLSNAQMGHENYAKHYTITTPEGKTIKIRNLNKFCRENNLSSGTMTLVAKGMRSHYKDYKVNYV